MNKESFSFRVLLLYKNNKEQPFQSDYKRLTEIGCFFVLDYFKLAEKS